MKTIYIVDIEPLDNRYTKQWHYLIPRQMEQLLPDKKIVKISGDTKNYKVPSTGAFFDFAMTCDYKASQAKQISQLFIDKKVNSGDVFFFTDAWNQSIHTLRYISELTNIPVKACGIWHAGWYDKTDILGKTIQNTDWVKPLELSMFNAYDLNFFATGSHVDIFKKEHSVDKSKAILVGYPFDHLDTLCVPDFKQKENIVVFPHRLNDDKAPYVFDWIEEMVTAVDKDILFVKSQEHDLDKESYYNLLKKAKVAFSCSKHENLGISMYEATKLGCIPVVPNKLSYVEMYSRVYRYDMNDLWYDERLYWVQIAEKILEHVRTYDLNQYNLALTQAKHMKERYFTGENMYHFIDRL
jgi:hypothetical protein